MKLNEGKIFTFEIQWNSRYSKPNSEPSNNIQRMEIEILNFPNVRTSNLNYRIQKIFHCFNHWLLHSKRNVCYTELWSHLYIWNTKNKSCPGLEPLRSLVIQFFTIAHDNKEEKYVSCLNVTEKTRDKELGIVFRSSPVIWQLLVLTKNR